MKRKEQKLEYGFPYSNYLKVPAFAPTFTLYVRCGIL